MRVGANDGAVLGTIHGDGGAEVRERVVSDLGVPEHSFGVTDVLVSLEIHETDGKRQRRVRAIEEVRGGGDATDSGSRGSHGVGTTHDGVGDSPGDRVSFEPLFEQAGDGLVPTGCLGRGNSRLVGTLAAPGESYADVREVLHTRAEWIADLADADRTGPETVERSRAEQFTSGSRDSRRRDPTPETESEGVNTP
jgi:flagellar protein FlaI